MNSYTYAWAKAFGLTLTVELAAAYFLMRWILAGPPFLVPSGQGETEQPRAWTGIDIARTLALIGFANLASHPSVWFIIPSIPVPYPTMVLIAETWAVLSETAFYALVFPRLGLVRALGVALVANGMSFGLGLILRSLTGLV